LRRADYPQLALTAAAAFSAILLSACETGTTTSSRLLPSYETPMARGDFQHVRTTAYTHTESDHTSYGAHNALGGELQAPSPAIRRAENVRRPAVFEDEASDYQLASYSPQLERFSDSDSVAKSKKSAKTARKVKKAMAVPAKKQPPKIGSAAADWGRWPAGTTFRLISTGQIYRVDDYGWALSGRNTIDLYMPTQREMNAWGAREEPIQILHWGDPAESLRLLAPHQDHRHIKRMMLELQGREEEAAALQ
jgi:3D (Asp-Asp-Asp) domain-containing protein